MRQPLDQYHTPAWALEAILPYLPQNPKLVVDPCCGGGNVLRAARKAWPKARTVGFEIDASLAADTGIEVCVPDEIIRPTPSGSCPEPSAWRHRVFVANSLDPKDCPRWAAYGSPMAPSPTLIWTNPPYKLGQAFVERALDEIDPMGTVAMLLRLAFMAGQGRRGMWTRRMADVYVLPKRPSFVHGKTDNSEYAWFVWGPERGGEWSRLEVSK